MEVDEMSGTKTKKKRIILRKGNKFIPARIEEIVFFYTESKLVFAIDNANIKYICDHKLMELEAMLDEKLFFRANRQYIVNLNYIKAFHTWERVRIHVEIEFGEGKYSVFVSQPCAPFFRKWIAGD